ncbi:hypothetical protein EVAR_79121_1 [Eumeta japonica]|uniref:Uncharacterized protein n=1 Tax=Eumeta variegata TaxID=151549 RepID=A0A4C1UU98_EUMVA|nr:hypothetical protein EVAR_79121_1 [Eumeta japonica]
MTLIFVDLEKLMKSDRSAAKVLECDTDVTHPCGALERAADTVSSLTSDTPLKRDLRRSSVRYDAASRPQTSAHDKDLTRARGRAGPPSARARTRAAGVERYSPSASDEGAHTFTAIVSSCGI